MKYKDSTLVLVGDGPLKHMVVDKVAKLGLSDVVYFLGTRSDVDKLLQGMDVFIMPTRFEGLSLALLEVQCSGLPCLTTDVVPREAKIAANFQFISLNSSSEEWANIALRNINTQRISGDQKVKEFGFDKNTAGKVWYEIYDLMAKDKLPL